MFPSSESTAGKPFSLFAVARCWLHFHDLEVRRRSSHPIISARCCGLVSSEGDRLSDIRIKVNRRTIDLVRDPFFIYELVFVRVAGAGQATGYFAVSFWIWGLTESESWRNHQDRQHKWSSSHESPLLAPDRASIPNSGDFATVTRGEELAKLTATYIVTLPRKSSARPDCRNIAIALIDHRQTV